jgi:signal transduction histidine kinase
MVQEVINNAAKHAGAKNFYIENFVNDSRVITLWDDGTGFDLSTEERGYGLNNILSRAKDIQAKMDIVSKQGEGTKVTIIIGDDSIWQ